MQLDGRLQEPDRQLYDIDLYDTPAKTIGDLKAVGRIVICYFSAGTWEDWRPNAAGWTFAAPTCARCSPNAWTWRSARAAMVSIRTMGMATAMPTACNDQLDFNRWLAREAHQRDLAVGLKNAVELLPQLVGDFDFAVNESCYVYKECDGYRLFRQQGEAVLIADYRTYNSNLCTQAAASGYRLQFFKRSLKGVGTPCK
jgi:hypothetical protein